MEAEFSKNPAVSRTRIWLLALTTAGALLRLLWLGRKSFWLDEGVSYLMATAPGRPHDSFWAYQALYHELLRFWIRLGDSEFMIRLFSAIPGVATIPVIYLLGKRMFNRRVGLYSTLLLTVHVSLILYSQEARSYALVVFLSSIATYYFVRAVEHDVLFDWGLYFLFSALAIYGHLLSALVIPAQFLSVAVLPSRGIPWRRLAVCAIALAAVAVPPALIILHGGAGGTEFIGRASYLQLPKVIAMLAGDAVTVPCYLVFWFMAARWLRRTFAGRERGIPAWHAALLVSWCVTPVALLMLVSLAKPAFVPRYLLVCAPAAVLLAARGLADLRLRPRILLLAATVLLSLGSLCYRQTRLHEDWRGAAQYVFASTQPGDAVLVLPPFARLPFVYYQHRFGGDSFPLELPEEKMPGGCVAPGVCWTVGPQASSPQGLGNPPWLQRLEDYRRLWVVVYTRAAPDFSTSSYAAALARDFHLQNEQHFKWIDVRLYVPVKNSRQ
jgi:hypothetical protein